MMGAIKGKNTLPELSVRRALHAKGFRFRLHDKLLVGKPDMVLPKWKAVVFVHGCFWHQHGCSNSKIPATRPAFWSQKLQSNVSRDRQHTKQLLDEGWRVAVVWECSIRRELKSGETGLFEKLTNWLQNRTAPLFEI
jgi:DNA mismatch endonuclease, patch repair protein